MELDRRRFMQLGAACTCLAAFGISGCTPKAMEETAGGPAAESEEPPESPIIKIRTTCGNCHNNCGVIANVQDGIILSFEGDPDHPFSRGALCPKARQHGDQVLILHPIKQRTLS